MKIKNDKSGKNVELIPENNLDWFALGQFCLRMSHEIEVNKDGIQRFIFKSDDIIKNISVYKR